MKIIVALLVFAGAVWAQDRVIYLGGGDAAKKVKGYGNTLPATCQPREIFIKHGSDPGVYGCTEENTWVGPSGVGASGDVEGPASSVDGEAAVFDGITGKLIKRFAGSGVGIFSSGVLSTDSGLQFNASTKSLGVFGPIISGQTSNYLGQFVLNGITSGAVTIQPANAAGTWTLTLPNSAGTNGQALVTNGSGVTSWTNPLASGLTAQYIDWNAASGGTSIANKPTLGTAAAATIGTGAGQVPVTGDYQPSDSDLTAIAALACIENEIIKRNGEGTWICAADATGGGGTVAVHDNANADQGDYSILQYKNGTGIAWTFTPEGGGRISLTPNLDGGSVVTPTGTQTVTGKTMTDLSIGTGYQTMRRANAGTTGTTINRLAKIGSTGGAVIATTSDTAIPLWIVAAGAGTTGSAELVTQGLIQLDMDGDCDIGDAVVASTSVGGEGHCTATPSAGAMVLALSGETGTGAGLYWVVVGGQYIQGGATSVTKHYGADFSSPTAGMVKYFRVTDACTITGWQILADGGTDTAATFDFWIVGTGSGKPTVTNTITASAKPVLVSGDNEEKTSTTLTDWTVAVGAKAVGAVKIDAISGSPTSIQATVYCQQ